MRDRRYQRLPNVVCSLRDTAAAVDVRETLRLLSHIHSVRKQRLSLSYLSHSILFCTMTIASLVTENESGASAASVTSRQATH